MDMIPYSASHGLSKEFARRFRDALFVFEAEDRYRLERFLRSQNTTWEQRLSKAPNWILKRAKRVVPAPLELHSTISLLFETFGNMKCANSKLPLFNQE